jgi:hypothetical protein
VHPVKILSRFYTTEEKSQRRLLIRISTVSSVKNRNRPIYVVDNLKNSNY